MNNVNRLLNERYLLEKLIGQGGMADVYLAEDTILNRTVAVKILRSSLTGDPVYIKRFRREASAATAISHRNIVSIYDVGEEDDLYYIVMEYVKGQTLKELIQIRGALHYVEAVDIMKQVTSAVALAHSKGIIHRDLKPHNILVTDSGIVKITDFGIASVQSLSQVTQTDTIMGSLHYLAPEIARGEKASPQSDIYSLGIVFYELLRGDVPFNGESPVNIALKHMRDSIPSVREFNSAIPQSIENIIIKATAKNLSNRYTTADEMLEDIDTCLMRVSEEKLVFDNPVSEPTIVAGNTEFYTKEKTGTQPVVVEKETRSQKRQEPVKEPKTINYKKYGIIGGVVAAIALCAVGIYFLLTPPKSDVYMPDIIGMNKNEALKQLKESEIEYSKTYRYELSDDYDKDIVIKTDPEKDTLLEDDAVVTITLSEGKYYVMEDFTGVEYSKAKQTLEDLGYKVSKYEKTDDTYKKGVVMEQSISAGEKQNPNNETKQITLTVSKGVIITVPSLYGESISSARKTLQNLGFKVKLSVLTPPTSEEDINKMTINTVVKQSIEPYTQVTSKGKSITLYYYDKKPEIKKEEPEEKPEETETQNTGETETQTE